MNNEVYYNTETLNKMTDKLTYYTPELNEITEGFYYEVIQPGSEEWVPYKFKSHQSLDVARVGIKHGYIRVPHLTKKDIERQGYKFQKENFGFKRLSMDSGVHIKCNFLTHHFLIEKTEIFGEEEVSTLFNGKIRNNNELETILKLIGL